MNVPIELLEKAKTAKTAEELLELAKAENVELTAKKAAKYFAELNKTGELSDEELDNVAGGCTTLSPTGKARNTADVQYLYPIGKYVEVINNKFSPYKTGSYCSGTSAAYIVDRKIELYYDYYYPKYKVRYRDDKEEEEWVWQNRIED